MAFSSDESSTADAIRRILDKKKSPIQVPVGDLSSDQDSDTKEKENDVQDDRDGYSDSLHDDGISSSRKSKSIPPKKDPWDDDEDSFPSIDEADIDAIVREHETTKVLGEKSPNVPKSIQVRAANGNDCSFMSELGDDTISSAPTANEDGNLSFESISVKDISVNTPVRPPSKPKCSNVFSEDSDDSLSPFAPQSLSIAKKQEYQIASPQDTCSEKNRKPHIQSSHGNTFPDSSSDDNRSPVRKEPPQVPEQQTQRSVFESIKSSESSMGSLFSRQAPKTTSQQRQVDHSTSTTSFHFASATRKESPSTDSLGTLSIPRAETPKKEEDDDCAEESPPSGDCLETLQIPSASPRESTCDSLGALRPSPLWHDSSIPPPPTNNNVVQGEQRPECRNEKPAASTSEQLYEDFVFEEPSTCEEEYKFSNQKKPICQDEALRNVDAFGFEVDTAELPSQTPDLLATSLNGPDTSTTHVEPTTSAEPLPPSPTGEGDHTDRPCEIDPTLYPIEPRRAEDPPTVHSFNSQNRPPASRRSVPVAQVFDGSSGGVSSLWRNKFDTFNHLQSEMANMMAYSDDNVVCSAPTGAGKTAIFEMALARFFAMDLQTPGPRKERGKVTNRRKAVYVSPSKALCEERYDDWSKRLKAMGMGIEVAVVTGDGDPGESLHDLSTAHFILTTPEKWDSLTRRWTEKFFLFSSVKLFLVDEVHLIADENRGCCLEAIVSRMKVIQMMAIRVQVAPQDLSSSRYVFSTTVEDETDKSCSSYTLTTPEAIGSALRFVAVSATLPNISEVAQFFDANEAYVFDESYRPVPLQTHVIGQGMLGGKNSNEFHFSRNLDRNVPEIIGRFSSGRPSIVFCHSKKETEQLADQLATTHSIGSRSRATAELASNTRISKLQRVLLHGVAYHHAGLDQDDRRLVEQAFSSGQVKVLCATSTLAMGVNLPAHLVVIKGTRAWRGSTAGYQDIDQASLLQMIGRAGRPGFDTSGTAVIMTDNGSKQRFQALASSGLDPAISKCTDDKLVETMNAEISQRAISCMQTAISWMKGSLFYVQLTRNPSYSSNSVDSHLYAQCKMVLAKLTQIEAVAVRDDHYIYPLAACHVMSHHLVDYTAMLQIAQMPFDTSQCQLLRSLANIEGLQRPVRRAEKKTLNSAQKEVKYKLEGPPSKVRVKDPWEKAFVLLQVYISELALDGNDFALRQEMGAMVDYASRMLSAIEEYNTKGTKNGVVAMECLRLRRSLAVRLWSGHQGTLKQIKGVTKALCFQLSNHGISTFNDVVKSSDEKIENAVNRMSPFGRELREAASRILQSAMSVQASVAVCESGLGPSTLMCNVKMKNEADSRSSSRGSDISYTLLAYSDQRGGCLLFEENITGPCSFTAMTPKNYDKIVVRLIGSVVGIDDAMEIAGKTPMSNIVASKGRAQRIRGAADMTKGKARVASKRKGQSQKVPHTQRTLPGMKLGKATVTPPPKKISADPVQPAIQAATTSDGQAGRPLHPTTKRSLPPTRGNEGSAESSGGSRANLSTPQRSQPHRQTVQRVGVPRANSTMPSEPVHVTQSSQTPGESTRLVHQQQRDVHSPLRTSQSTWKRAKLQHERTQRRAFVRKKDNPFSIFSHDPNNSESVLEHLSSQSDQIIPTEALNQAHQSVRPTFFRPPNTRGRHSRVAKHRRSVTKPTANVLREEAAELGSYARADDFGSHHPDASYSYAQQFNNPEFQRARRERFAENAYGGNHQGAHIPFEQQPRVQHEEWICPATNTSVPHQARHVPQRPSPHYDTPHFLEQEPARTFQERFLSPGPRIEPPYRHCWPNPNYHSSFPSDHLSSHFNGGGYGATNNSLSVQQMPYHGNNQTSLEEATGVYDMAQDDIEQTFF